jgi:sugar phosphate isomerase/epimerase
VDSRRFHRPNAGITVKLALQLYSLRREFAAAAEATLRRVPALGYDGIELAGTYGWSADQWKKLLAETKLTVVGAHVGLADLETKWAETASFQRAIGNHRLVVPSLPKELHNAAGFREAAHRLNALGKTASAGGFHLYYHNHSFEFAPLGAGRCGMDILLAETDQSCVAFEVDTYWVERGGLDSRQFIERHAGRIGLIHAKELRKRDNADVPAGQGDIDFKFILPFARQKGWPVVVEFEGENAISAVTESARYLAVCA